MRWSRRDCSGFAGPQRAGGYELSLRIQSDTVTAVSRARLSGGWILMAIGAHHFCLGVRAERAQEEVSATGTAAWSWARRPGSMTQTPKSMPYIS